MTEIQGSGVREITIPLITIQLGEEIPTEEQGENSGAGGNPSGYYLWPAG